VLDPALTDPKALAQLTYTLTQFDSVQRVSFNGDRPVGRGAFEEETPAILVESPLSGEAVESGFEATGTANTFEATFEYELRDVNDKILKKDFVTATSGSGTRGTFRFTVPYEAPGPQAGRLVVFEISAEDGSRKNERSTPLALR
jgi:germination protein M